MYYKLRNMLTQHEPKLKKKERLQKLKDCWAAPSSRACLYNSFQCIFFMTGDYSMAHLIPFMLQLTPITGLPPPKGRVNNWPLTSMTTLHAFPHHPSNDFLAPSSPSEITSGPLAVPYRFGFPINLFQGVPSLLNYGT